MLDIEKVASLSVTLYKNEILDLLNILSTLDKDGEILLKEARKVLLKHKQHGLVFMEVLMTADVDKSGSVDI